MAIPVKFSTVTDVLLNLTNSPALVNTPDNLLMNVVNGKFAIPGGPPSTYVTNTHGLALYPTATSEIYWVVPSRSGGQPWTFVFNFYVQDTAITSGGILQIASTSSASGVPFLLLNADTGNNLRLYVKGGYNITATGVLLAKSFHSVAVTFDGNLVTFVRNGYVVGTYNPTGDVGSSTSTHFWPADGYPGKVAILVNASAYHLEATPIEKLKQITSDFYTKTDPVGYNEIYTPSFSGFPTGPRIHYVVYPSSETRFPQQDDVVKEWPGVATTSGYEKAPEGSSDFTFAADASALAGLTTYKIAYCWYDGLNYSPVEQTTFTTLTAGIPGVPTLSAVTLYNVTSTTARPRVTITF